MPAANDLPEWAYSPDLGVMLQRESEDLYVIDPRPPKAEWLEGEEGVSDPGLQKEKISSLQTGDEIRMIPLATRRQPAAPGKSVEELWTNGNPWSGGSGGGGGSSGGGGGGIAIGVAIGAAGNATYDGAKKAFHWISHHL
jgi:hypothetical protein